jgi:hypothetical protein
MRVNTLLDSSPPSEPRKKMADVGLVDLGSSKGAEEWRTTVNSAFPPLVEPPHNESTCAGIEPNDATLAALAGLHDERS